MVTAEQTLIANTQTENTLTIITLLRDSNFELSLTVGNYINMLQVAGAGFRGPLLVCLLNLTTNEKSASHTLQFASKYYVFLN